MDTESKAVKRQSIADKVSFQLERLVLDGELKPGDRLPPERELAERFGASRNGVREAIRRLETLGLLSTEPQSGTYIRDYLEEASFDLIMYLMENGDTLDPAMLLQLLEYREMLMTTAARFAALRDGAACSADLMDLAEALAVTVDVATVADIDYRFHSRLVKGSGNLMFRSLHNTSRSAHIFYTKLFFSEPGTIEATASQQRNIAAAIGSGNGEAAALAVSAALDYGRTILETMVARSR